MMYVALIMRPWIILMRVIPGIQVFILADDVLILATGKTMIGQLAEAINRTHQYLHEMGAKVAPDKSYNFASTVEGKKWLQQTWWEGIQAKIDVVQDFRYLGAHLSAGNSISSATMDKRWEKAQSQLKKLKHAPASNDAKVKAIHAKVYASAMYGIEAAAVTPAKIAKLAASVIDVFRWKNNNHNADRFFTTLTPDDKDIDPVVEILARRAMQIRRTASKNKGMEAKVKELLLMYATRHSNDDKWPLWFQPGHASEPSTILRPKVFPCEQPHPTTKQHDRGWNDQIDPVGPVGLLVEAAVWNGLVIDCDLRLWQENEEPIDILRTPYQGLKVAVKAMASRARTAAEWRRDTSKKLQVKEIDREASQLSKKLTDQEKGIVSTAMMGGTQAKQEIAAYNEDIDPWCSHCKKGPSTVDHIRWECEAFEPTRVDTDPELAKVPRKYLSSCIRCGIAPAMKVDGDKTYWGVEVDADEDKNVKKLLGIDLQLYKPGKDGDETEKREMAVDIIEDPDRGRLNARQTMLKYKGGHSTGVVPTFPTRQNIEVEMADHGDDFYVDIFGDGSYTTPDKWWAAIGGTGVWIPAWNKEGDNLEHRNEKDEAAPNLGQTGSSTRMELAAWILVLTKPIRSNYATDSKSMMDKALHLIQQAKVIEDKRSRGEKVNSACPYKKVWGCKSTETCGRSLGKRSCNEAP